MFVVGHSLTHILIRSVLHGPSYDVKPHSLDSLTHPHKDTGNSQSQSPPPPPAPSTCLYVAAPTLVLPSAHHITSSSSWHHIELKIRHTYTYTHLHTGPLATAQALYVQTSHKPSPSPASQTSTHPHTHAHTHTHSTTNHAKRPPALGAQQARSQCRPHQRPLPQAPLGHHH